MDAILNLTLLGSIHVVTTEQQESFPHLPADGGHYQRQNIGMHCTVGSMADSRALPCA